MQETMAEYEARLLRGSGVDLLLAGAPSDVSHPPSAMLVDANRRKAIEEEERRRPSAPTQQPQVLLTAPAAAFTKGPTNIQEQRAMKALIEAQEREDNAPREEENAAITTTNTTATASNLSTIAAPVAPTDSDLMPPPPRPQRREAAAAAEGPGATKVKKPRKSPAPRFEVRFQSHFTGARQ